MNRNTLVAAGIAVAAVLFLLSNALYVVDQTTQVLVLRLGEPVRMVNTPKRPAPGLHVKTPFVEQIVRFDKRNIALEIQPQEIFAADQGRIVVDAFVRYRINDPRAFYRALRDQNTANNRIGSLTQSAMRETLGRSTTSDIISGRRAALMQAIEDDIARQALASRYGVEILDLRLRRADLPDENRDAVYQRMQSDRQREAQVLRATGEREATRIRSEAENLGNTIRGEGDAARARIYAESFGKDPSFAAFYRSMAAYEQTMANGETTLVLSPDSEFFRYFSRGPGR